MARSFDFGIASAPLIVRYVVHNAGYVVTAAPPCGLFCVYVSTELWRWLMLWHVVVRW